MHLNHVNDLPSSDDFAYAAVLLAAGASSRMGRPKMLLPWRTTTILGHLHQLWLTLGAAQIGVVFDPKNVAVISELDRLNLPVENRIPNPAPHLGMFSSIQSASAWPHWQPKLTHWLIVLGDQPHLSIHTLTQFLAFAARHPLHITQPAHHCQPQHPVCLPKSQFHLLHSTNAPDLKKFLQNQPQPPLLCELPDPNLNLDLDTPADYNTAWNAHCQTDPPSQSPL